MNNDVEAIIYYIEKKYSKKLMRIKNDFYILSVKYNLNKFKKIIKEQRMLLKTIILDIISYFPELKKSDFIMFNGSYGRHSNILFSDIDLNIMYKDNLKKQFFQ